MKTQIKEEVTRAATFDHLLDRAKKVVSLITPIANKPLLFREFRHRFNVESVIIKVINDREEFIAKKGSNNKQPEVLKALNIKKPVFCRMSTPHNVSNVLGISNIVIPPTDVRLVWSPVVKDLGGNDIVGPKKSKFGHQDLGKGLYRAPSLTRMVGPEFANTYEDGWPPTITVNEVILDCEFYYLLDLGVFLKKFIGDDGPNLLTKTAYGANLNRELFEQKFTNYGNVIWYLENTFPKYVNWYRKTYTYTKGM